MLLINRQARARSSAFRRRGFGADSQPKRSPGLPPSARSLQKRDRGGALRHTPDLSAGPAQRPSDPEPRGSPTRAPVGARPASVRDASHPASHRLGGPDVAPGGLWRTSTAGPGRSLRGQRRVRICMHARCTHFSLTQGPSRCPWMTYTSTQRRLPGGRVLDRQTLRMRRLARLLLAGPQRHGVQAVPARKRRRHRHQQQLLHLRCRGVRTPWRARLPAVLVGGGLRLAQAGRRRLPALQASERPGPGPDRMAAQCGVCVRLASTERATARADEVESPSHPQTHASHCVLLSCSAGTGQRPTPAAPLARPVLPEPFRT